MKAGADVGHVPALEAVCSPEGGPLPAELLRLFWCRQSAAGNFSCITLLLNQLPGDWGWRRVPV